ncbi:MAG: TetR family transcriptional regulator, partial [Betaproteobacteria bacterium]|nr:TetR family transcriptional regulator [Betaproteobacteria bacterium]
ADSDTRQRILDGAELLFTQYGFEATTLRRITGAAEVNLAAVNYHFGSKEELIRELFRRRLTWLNQQRLQELDRLEAEAGDKPLKPSQILEVFFGVALRMAADTKGGGRAFMRLLGRTYAKPSDFVRGFLAEEYAAVVARFKAALIKALPGVPGEEILWRFHFMLGAMSYAISGTDALHIVAEDALDDDDAEALYARLMSFMLGGLRAPLPALRAGSAKPSRVKKAA